MKTDFNKAREWRCAQKVSAIILLVIAIIGILAVRSRSFGGIQLASAVASLAVCVTGLIVYKNSRCPYCGKSPMSAWTGRDGSKRNCIRRIEKRQPVICAHCGAEVDTDD